MRILIISYVFPPYPGVGGRRWAKFSKELARKGFEIDVICARNPLPVSSSWTKDVEHRNITIHQLPSKFPVILLETPKGIWQKIRYRAWTGIFAMFSNGFIFERTLFWKNALVKRATELIRGKNIPTVIVTGPPFLLLHQALDIRKKFPGIKLICDIRDIWTDNKTDGDKGAIALKRLETERKKELEVYKGADLIITVSDHMAEMIRKKIPGMENKVKTIINGFDPDEFVAAPAPKNFHESKKCRFVYTGSLYPGLEYIFIPFLEQLQKLKNDKPELFAKLQFDFYGHAFPGLVDRTKNSGLGDVVRFHKSVSRMEIGGIAGNSDVCMLFVAEDHSFSMNTKFVEYLAYRKPVLMFSSEGKTPDFIRENNLGLVLTPETIALQFSAYVHALSENKIIFNSQFDISAFSVPFNTEKLVGYLD